MHKIFAKPLFLGKKVVFLPQCHSTNDELVMMARKSNEPEGTVIYTDYQKKGKGQRGNIWVAEPGKNVLMSVLLRPKFLSPQDQYYLNLIAGLAIVDTLKGFIHKSISLKWPNDVYVEDRKIAGVLIENNLRGSMLEYSVVGIGLNVNQSGFDIQTATSVYLAAGEKYQVQEVMEELLLHLEGWYLKLKNGDRSKIQDQYLNLLMWRGELRRFRSSDGEFDGEIVGIDSHGRLNINSKGRLQSFGIKEVEFIG
ncbi:biotin--[acetyl-CoA-carboxylase] ligase [Ekhidna sp.]|uniref:biotin--[acetyl-CoA-carboxylase] ligase n=1 Tax=Ekhidna sp. TaxID=2608089 RepID=UPI00351762D7